MAVSLRERERDTYQENQEENLRGNIKNLLLEILSFSPQSHLNGSPSFIKLLLVCSGGKWLLVNGDVLYFLLRPSIHRSPPLSSPSECFLSYRSSQAVYVFTILLICCYLCCTALSLSGVF